MVLQVLSKPMLSAQSHGCAILDVVSYDNHAAVFFASDTDLEKVQIDARHTVISNEVNSGALTVNCTLGDYESVRLLYDGVTIDAVPNPAEHDLFRGANVAVATRNGEDEKTIAQWLVYHKNHFNMTGAVIFERSPSRDEKFIKKLSKRLEKDGYEGTVVFVDSQIPLGKPDLPPEANPWNVAEAPGHSRMEQPPSDRWSAPLGEMSIFEIARYRFLAFARAVANLDLHDLLFQTRDLPNVFDAAANDAFGIVGLIGRHCYPWRVRKDKTPSYGDHTCIQFDRPKYRKRWCVAPALLEAKHIWKITKIAGLEPHAVFPFYRCMAIRHPTTQVSEIVPKTSIVESPDLLRLATEVFDFNPVRAPEVKAQSTQGEAIKTAIVTTMKDEGPFILEWLAYHRVIGVENFLVYTNDCSDGTDTFLELLQKKGLLQHRDNPFRDMNLKPQHAALQSAETEEAITLADWVICMDVDEYINVKVGDGHLRDLYTAVGDANMISLTWRLFGNADVHEYTDVPIISIFDKCAEELTPKPHQAWGFKTLFRNIEIFKKLGVHRPKGLRPQLWDQIRWVNGSGKPLPRKEYRGAWRSTQETYGYDLVSLNHYAVRTAESFLVKRHRGRVNHVDRDQGLAYWFRMNNNTVQETTIQRMIPKVIAEIERLKSDPEIAAAHEACVQSHRAKIDQLRQDEAYSKFYEELTSARMERLSRMHKYFGANVFLAGPQSVPDEVVFCDHTDDFFFTVEATEATH